KRRRTMPNDKAIQDPTLAAIERHFEKASHTPGPWKEYAPAIWNDAHTEEVVDENYRYIEAGKAFSQDGTGGFHLTGFIRREDARLIAAAPDMLEALEECRKELIGATSYLATCDPVTIIQNLDSFIASLKARLAVVEAAIRKAKGEL